MEQLLLQVHVANFWIQVVGASATDFFFVRLKEHAEKWMAGFLFFSVAKGWFFGTSQVKMSCLFKRMFSI